jgi:hypothetical protein
MKLRYILLIGLVLGFVAMGWDYLSRGSERPIQAQTCPEWLVGSPQKGCEDANR